MKQFYDETHSSGEESSRTLWYGYFGSTEDEGLKNQICQLVEADLQKKFEKTPTATHWIFYREELQKDALTETIRSSMTIRFREGKYVVHYNMSDFEFVLFYDAITTWVRELEDQLNKK
ncbi:hypothetical protein X560_0901 [Listeria fleischmannii 1991]|uniref:Uncharacterized protein n=2 Tax=Listeria fleischmannii TaxID=1069827 RepID=A0A2X3H755_9LIST|nr:hypothetical protein [Listeria fleischmannii]EMG26690.1 hypothetical protein LFLEISCH_15146 [Listeria fleischmannii subsp. fleischmannii LU2006-1]KMT60289.1 hypothetical protein X560_0901 [Listeria fleischmannii 1991]SQC70366.1 Uncharacterised protein [Listeria fleischmannii subsp. fleischmannii]